MSALAIIFTVFLGFLLLYIIFKVFCFAGSVIFTVIWAFIKVAFVAFVVGVFVYGIFSLITLL